MRLKAATVRSTKMGKPAQSRDFEIEGELVLSYSDTGRAAFMIDNCFLSEFVQRHFRAQADDQANVSLGKVKIIVAKVFE